MHENKGAFLQAECGGRGAESAKTACNQQRLTTVTEVQRARSGWFLGCFFSFVCAVCFYEAVDSFRGVQRPAGPGVCACSGQVRP